MWAKIFSAKSSRRLFRQAPSGSLFWEVQPSTITRLPTGDPARRGVLCESVLHIAAQRVDVDALHRAPVSLVLLVHSTASARLPQIAPVRSLVTGAAKLSVDQRLQTLQNSEILSLTDSAIACEGHSHFD
jgi:hypothetical protein